MTTQPTEVFGVVIGFVATVDLGLPTERQIKFTLADEFEDICRRQASGEFQGVLFATEIKGPKGIELSGGANPNLNYGTPFGTRMRKLTCRCGQSEWLTAHIAGARIGKFFCEGCSESRADEDRLYWRELRIRTGEKDDMEY